MAPRRAVYTAAIGRHDLLAEQPTALASGVDLICFTDDPDLRSDSWEIRLVRPLLPLDPVRSARAIKIGGHPDLEAYDETLWVDARIRLSVAPDVVLDEWLDGVDLALLRHSYRSDVVTEFEEVLAAGLDDFTRLYEQLTHYAAVAPERLEAPVPATGILARRRTPAVAAVMDEWLLHVLRYSRRDQLSFVEAAGRVGADYRLIDLDLHESDLHEWLPGEGRSARPSVFQVSQSLQPPIARVGELQRELDVVRTERDTAVTHRDEIIARQQAEIGDLHDRLAEAAAAAGAASVSEATATAGQVAADAAAEQLRRRVRRLLRRNRDLTTQLEAAQEAARD